MNRVSCLFVGAVIWMSAGCSTTPYRPADIDIKDAHRGGTALALDAETTLLASGGRYGYLRLWQVPTGEPVGSWQAHREHITGLAFVNRGAGLLSGSIDGSIALWQPAGKLVQRRSTSSPVTAIAVDELEELLLTGHSDGSVRRWRLPGMVLMESRLLHRDGVHAVAISTTGRLASSGADGRIFLWSPPSDPQALETPAQDSHALAFSPDGHWLYGAGWFDLMRWDLDSGSLQNIGTEHHGRIADIRFTANGRQLVSISRITDSTVLLLDPASGNTLNRLEPHALCGAAVVVSGDGRTVASTSDDGSIHLWRLLAD